MRGFLTLLAETVVFVGMLAALYLNLNLLAAVAN